MKFKNVLLLVLTVVSFSFAQVDSLWERTAEDGTLPSWFDTGHLTRGFAYGNVGGNDRLYVVSRNGGNNVYIMDALTGADVGTLSTAGIAGGTYLLSDIAVSDDGVIFMCNLTTSSSTSALKVYRWDTESDEPTNVITWTGGTAFRLGDKMSASGSVADNSAYLSFAASNADTLVGFTTSDNGANWEAELWYVGMTGGSADASMTPDGGAWYNATGINPVRFSTEGALNGVVPGSVVPTGSNAIQYLEEVNGMEYVATFNYGTGNEKAIILRAPAESPESASSYGVTPSLFLNSNANGAGDVAMMHNADGSATVFVLSTNNGIGAYQVAFPTEAMEANNMESVWWADVTNYDFFNNDNNTRGMGYNPVTDHLLVASRTGGTLVHIIDASSGGNVGTLDMTGVTGGTFPINKVVADDNGVIYVANMTVGGAGYKVYRWADESAVPTLAFEGDFTNRTGDAMGIYGSGTETVLYASGANSPEVVVLRTTDGLTYTASTPVTVGAGQANGGISAVEDTSIAINSGWGEVYHIDVMTDTYLDTVGGDLIPSYFGNIRYLRAPNGAEMLITNTNHQDGHRREMEVYKISDAGIELYASAEIGGLEYGNGNVTGDIWYRLNVDNTVTIFQMASNNGIAAWNMELPPTEAYISDYALDFGEVAINGNASLTIQIGNVGTTDMVVDSLSLGDALDFSFNLETPITIAADDTIDVVVTFTPVFEGASDATLEINTNAGTYNVALTGVGYELWPLEWRFVADTTTWIGQGDLARGVAFNRTTGHILVPSRVGGSFVHILDGATGAMLDSLDMTGVEGGTYHMNMVSVADDGQIFLCNLAAWGGQIFRLYHWTDEQAAPTRIIDANYDDFGARLGDAMGVSGTGDNVKVFLSGSGATKIVQFELTEADTFAATAEILLPAAGAARFGLSPVDEDGTYFFINGAGTAPYYLKNDGTVLHEFDTAVIPSGTSIEYINMPVVGGDTRHFVGILNGWATGTYGVELFGTPGDSLCTSYELAPAPTDMYADFANGNAAGQLTYNTWTNSLVELVTNNGLSSYSFSVIEPLAVTDAPAEPVLSATSVDFGEVAINGSAYDEFTIVNTGEGDLWITDVSIETYDGAFETTLESGTMISGNGMDTVVVGISFIPFQEGATAANLILTTNAGTLTIALSGTGYELWPLEWRVEADGTDWFYQAGVFQDMVRSMAFNPVTGHILAVSRIGGSFIWVLDGITGDTLGTVNTTGIAGGTYNINQIAVTDDGQIFVCNLAAWGGQVFKVYHIADETAEPVVVVEGNYDDYSVRVGDSFGVAGMGNAITVYTSGSAADRIITFETIDGVSFARGDDIVLPEANAAHLGISAIDADHLFINGAGPGPRYINSDGDVLHAFETAVIPSGTNIQYFEVATSESVRKFVGITNGWSSGTSVVELLGTTLDGLCSEIDLLAAPTANYAENANLNATAHMVYNNHTNSIVELITNNGISSYSFDVVEPAASNLMVFYGDDAVLVENPYADGYIAGTNSYGDIGKYQRMDVSSGNMTGFSFYFGEVNIVDDPDELNLVVRSVGADGAPADLLHSIMITTDELRAGMGGNLWYFVEPLEITSNIFVGIEMSEGANDTLALYMDMDGQGDGASRAWEQFSDGGFNDFGTTLNPDYSWGLDADLWIAALFTDYTLPVVGIDEEAALPASFMLSQNYPNPFNPSTTINFALPVNSEVRLVLFNILGQEVAVLQNGYLPAGFHQFQLNGSELASGVYLYRVEAGSFTDVRKMILLK